MTDKTFGIFDQNTSTAKNVDVAEITRPDDTVVERQRIAIGDGDEGDATRGLIASVRGEIGRGTLQVSSDTLELLASIDRTLREIRDALIMTLESIED